MKQRRERKQNSIEVENEITYGESIVSNSSLYNRCCLFGFGDLC